MIIQEHFDEWKVLRDAPEAGPAPADGRLVIALEPPSIDGWAEMVGGSKALPRCEHLAMAWTNRCGEEVVHPTDGYLLMGCQGEATWLPEGWEMDVFPTGWTLAHLEQWFRYAFRIVKLN